MTLEIVRLAMKSCLSIMMKRIADGKHTMAQQDRRHRCCTMALPRMTWTLPLSMLLASAALGQHQIVCSGEAAGGYAAFPDVCRLQNGELYCVFYSGYGHVSTPNEKWPKGGRIMAVRSLDNGKTWSEPVVAIDTDLDDRDPSVACLRDGTLILNWFTLDKNQVAVLLARSTDNGKTWSEPDQL